MKELSTITLLCFCIYLYACNRGKEHIETQTLADGHVLKVKKNRENKIIGTRQFLNDTLDGLSQGFYDNGRIRYKSNYVKGKRSGWQKFYFKNGVLSSESYWNNDLQDGECYSYYENGKLEEESYWYKGTNIYDVIHYDTNGKIDWYNSRDFFGKAVYARIYKNGKLTYSNGRIFSFDYNVVPRNASIRDTMTAQVYVAAPPRSSTKILYGDIDSSTFKSSNLKEGKNEEHSFFIRRKFQKPGRYYMTVIGVMHDSDANKTILDTMDVLFKIQ